MYLVGVEIDWVAVATRTVFLSAIDPDLHESVNPELC